MKKIFRWILTAGLMVAAACTHHAYADTSTTRWNMTKPDIGSANWGPKLNTNADTIDNAAGVNMTNTFSSSQTFNAAVGLGGSTVTWNAGVDSGTITDISTRTYSGGKIAGIKSDSSSTTFNGAQLNGIKTDNSTTTVTGSVTATNAYSNTSSSMSIRGVISGIDAKAGDYGEFISSATLAKTIAANAQYGDMATITLTPGDWDIGINIYVAANGATVTYCESGIATSSGNSATGAVAGDNYNAFLPPTSAAQNGIGIAPWRTSITSTTQYYLKLVCGYSVATPRANARISARRVR